MEIVEITRDRFPARHEMRLALYSGIDDAFHDAEIGNLDSQRFIESLGLRETYRVVEYAVSLTAE